MKRLCPAFVLAVALGLSSAALAQTYSIDWFTIDGGGGTSSGGPYTVSGTIGQPDAGRLSGGNFTVEGGFWGGLFAVQTLGAPTLLIQKAGGNFTVSWVPTTPGFVLQVTDSLSPPAWTNAPSGATNPILVPASPTTRFYRLKQQ